MVRPVLVAAGVCLLLGCRADTPDAGDAATIAEAAPTPPLDPDIWIADLSRGDDGTLTVGAPTSAISRPGYDNQPHFVPDGTGFWFTATDEHDGQSDIWRYDLATPRVSRITMSSPESEYSATPLPNGAGISVVRVEADSTQRIWRFDSEGSSEAVLLPDVAPVGYQAWADARTLVLFVLGDPPTLRVTDTETGETRIAAEGIGRSIQSIPGTADVSFVQREEDGSTTVMRLRTDDLGLQPLIAGIEGGDFHAWTPDATLLMAHEGKIYAWAPGADDRWREIADLSALRVRISRLAVSPDGTKIVMVVEPAQISL